MACVKQDWILHRICKLTVSESTLTSNNSLIILKQPQLVRSHLKLLLALHLIASLYLLDPQKLSAPVTCISSFWFTSPCCCAFNSLINFRTKAVTHRRHPRLLKTSLWMILHSIAGPLFIARAVVTIFRSFALISAGHWLQGLALPQSPSDSPCPQN